MKIVFHQTPMEAEDLLTCPDYDFLKKNHHLGKNVILLGLSGSYGYGTNKENSDIDLRGITLNRKSDLIGLTEFEQYVDENTDTTIYGFNKYVSLLLGCNPNTMELLGLRRENYLYLHELGQELIEKAGIFLSRRAIQSFTGYASAQIRRLQNALASEHYPQKEKEYNILKSLESAMYEFKKHYEKFEEGAVHLYLDKAVNPNLEKEIFMDIRLKHYPLRDYKGMWGEMDKIVKDYERLGSRDKRKDDEHLNKHAMHLLRLFMMGIDILEKGEIRTFREEEHDLLMKVRNGKFQREDGTFRDEFYDIVQEYERNMEYAAKHTCLPQEPDMEMVQDYVMSVNERAVKDEI
ncbi:MAG: DNA polymerase beta superfamily protein [Ruminococcus sp.]|jgi:predicted nucleotidyltransferase